MREAACPKGMLQRLGDLFKPWPAQAASVKLGHVSQLAPRIPGHDSPRDVIEVVIKVHKLQVRFAAVQFLKALSKL